MALVLETLNDSSILAEHCHRPLKRLSPPAVTEFPFENVKVQLICEMDEQWSFVGSKKNQRWLWYVWEPRFKRIIAHVFGRRTDATLKKLLKLLEPYSFEFFCTDDWKSYAKYLPEKQHIIGKHFTQRLERQNLNFRTHLKRLGRRSICFSRSEEIHDKVIGKFIYRDHYQLF